jgi:hypothetical protein
MAAGQDWQGWRLRVASRKAETGFSMAKKQNSDIVAPCMMQRMTMCQRHRKEHRV